MDSITHLFLGGALAAAIAPAKHRRAALLAGAAINTLPDLAVIPLFTLSSDPVVHMTWHRAATHSLLVLPFVAWALWWLLKSRWAPVRDDPRRGFWMILVTLLAHPLIDACTVYGTQLWWPLPVPPAMWSSLFIIDPLFTLPLVLACVLAWAWKERERATRALTVGLVLAGGYVGWSLAAKAMVDRAAQQALAAQGLGDAPRFSVPMPFNTLLWRVVAMTPDGFVEGERSLWADRGPMVFRTHRSDTQALAEVAEHPSVARLLWFNHHFAKASVEGDKLVLADLRMGLEPAYSFRFAVAERDGAGWRAIPVTQAPWPTEMANQLPRVWERIWREPPMGGGGQAASATPAINASK